MLINNTTPVKLIESVRDGLVDRSHFGFVYGAGIKLGETNGYPFYLRSCAKPLQAALIVDCELDFDSDELALCCASHAGEVVHVELARHLLKKIGLREELLKCGLHKPISKTEQEKLIRKHKSETVFQNNCVGKHIMMLALCKKNGWDYCDYDDVNHPLQLEIKKKIYELCELDSEYPITKDGCGVPIHSMPLENMIKGYLNLFCSDKYKMIKDAFLKNPYIIGGENRLDTKIMKNSKELIAKVGAGGLCIVVNLNLKKAFVVKISDCDMEAREIAMLSILKQLDWANIETDLSIKTLHGETVGYFQFTQSI